MWHLALVIYIDVGELMLSMGVIKRSEGLKLWFKNIIDKGHLDISEIFMIKFVKSVKYMNEILENVWSIIN